MTAPDAPPASERRVVRALALTSFLQWLGASAMLPLLPVFVRHRGGSDAVVGAVMAAFFAAQLLLQYPAGRLADRIGRRPVLVAGLLVYALASVAFVLRVPPVVDIGLRFAQGAGAAAVTVCAFAIVAGTVPPERRGRAVGTVFGGQLAGLAFGPFLGSVAGLAHLSVVFVAAAVLSLAACLPVLAEHLPEVGEAARRPALSLVRHDRGLLGALVAAAAVGLVIGVYEACWTLLLVHRGAHPWQIGLSWTMFALPLALMSRPGGWLADRLDRRLLVVVSLVVSIGFCVAYPFIDSLPALLVLGAVEAVGFAVGLPASQSLLTQRVPDHEQGQAQGLFGTSETGAITLSAAAGGALFGMDPAAPFLTAAGLALVLTATLPFLWATVPGRVAHSLAPDPA